MMDIKLLKKMAYERTSQAARILATELKTALANNDLTELVKVAQVVKELATPLKSEFEPLLFYARAIAKWADDDISGAIDEFKSLKNSGRRFKPGCYAIALSKRYGCLKITDVMLDMPAEIFERVSEIFQPPTSTSGHFSIVHTRLKNADILKTSLKKLGFVVKKNAEIRGSMGKKVPADIVVILNGDYDLGWKLNANNTFDAICDFAGISELYNLTELINSIVAQYDKIVAKGNLSED